MKKDILPAPIAEANEQVEYSGGVEHNNLIEFHGRKAMKVKIDSRLLPPYIEEILVNSLCDVLLPMGFLDKEKSLAYFDLTDVLSLKELWKLWKENGEDIGITMIEVFTNIIKTLYLIENLLFLNKGFRLEWDYIFFVKQGRKNNIDNSKNKSYKIKLAFFPDENEAMVISTNLSKKILKLIYDSLIIVLDEEWNYCGNQLGKLIKVDDSLLDIGRKLNHLAREISSRDWPDLSSLQQF